MTPLLSTIGEIQAAWLGLFLSVVGIGAVYAVIAKLIRGGGLR